MSNLIERLRQWDDPHGIKKEAADRIQELEAVIRSHGIPVKTATGGEAHYMMGDVERDAARYRWLRDLDNDAAEMCDKNSGIELDAAIDAAMKEQP